MSIEQDSNDEEDISNKVSNAWQSYNIKKSKHIGSISKGIDRGLHWRVFHHKSAFGKAACCALVIGIGDLMATGADLYWLAGDIQHAMLPHHIPVAVVLGAAFLVMVLSFAYLYHSIVIFLHKQEDKHNATAVTKRQLEDRLVQLEGKLLLLEYQIQNGIISNGFKETVIEEE